MVEPIGEGGTGAGVVPTTERPLSVASRVADTLLGLIVGNAFRGVEILGGAMEEAYEWMDGDYRRHMAALRRGGIPLDKQHYRGFWQLLAKGIDLLRI